MSRRGSLGIDQLLQQLPDSRPTTRGEMIDLFRATLTTLADIRNLDKTRRKQLSQENQDGLANAVWYVQAAFLELAPREARREIGFLAKAYGQEER